MAAQRHKLEVVALSVVLPYGVDGQKEASCRIVFALLQYFSCLALELCEQKEPSCSSVITTVRKSPTRLAAMPSARIFSKLWRFLLEWFYYACKQDTERAACAVHHACFCSIDFAAEVSLLTQLECRGANTPTFFFGVDKNNDPVVYKPKLSGLKKLYEYSVLQTDCYLIDLELKVKASKILHAKKLRTASAVGALRDTNIRSERKSIDEMVARIFSICTALVIVNAFPITAKIVCYLGREIVPIEPDKLIISEDNSALFKAVSPQQVPYPYSKNSKTFEANPEETSSVSMDAKRRGKLVLEHTYKVFPPFSPIDSDTELEGPQSASTSAGMGFMQGSADATLSDTEMDSDDFE
ncbi:uncharacterized protein LOC34622389 [Cyclospora cayetanensis]|uniref:Uncharacterized protein LOC34622389 n=1 Tax=Cyclospora cayetanensis TaxID=88456 RepID=A0A6P6RST7_9EIME|nr:uncharacterized protein LOC34622389 [Cyclospora cayetanensis]